ncbi:MAG TPA: EF-P lysine aminoacylase EpmA, partial [Steroidobacteraceae bacterium]|nr:EF-P lysine aminoacylase EpmA [Steroidobacteraceae bacterium]
VDLGAPPGSVQPTGAVPGDVQPTGAVPQRQPLTPAHYLHTSPEYAMKRLLAAGSGDIYQICHVVRGFEHSPVHNPEFTLVEWYRLGFALPALMDEVEALVRVLLVDRLPGCAPCERVPYREAFGRTLGLDPLECGLQELAAAAHDAGYHATGGRPERDELLDFLMAVVIGPTLGRGGLTFIHGYPASQAALARLDPAEPRLAARFELYCEGLELANGFHELQQPAEQRARFERDLEERRRQGLAVPGIDERLLAALGQGLPDCAGVALGFDRTLMLACGAGHIREVLSFPTQRA